MRAPWSSRRWDKRKVGVPDPEKASVVVEMFERYATGAYSDQQIAEWLNEQGFRTSQDHPFGKDTVRVNLLQVLVICTNCGWRLRIQTPKNCPTCYRVESYLRGYHDCPYTGQSVRAQVIDAQIAELIQSIHLPENWEPIVLQMLDNQSEKVDSEAELKEIRSILRLMQDNYDRGKYVGEEYQYWQKVNVLKEKLELLNRIPEAVIDRAHPRRDQPGNPSIDRREWGI